MAKFYKSIILLTSYIFLLSSCQEGGDAGDFLGQWKLANSEKEYLSFSGSVVLFRSVPQTDVYGNFQHVGDSLFIQCYSSKQAKRDTVMIEDDMGFKPFNNIRVKIETLDSDVLVLSKDGKTWNYVKY